MNSHEKPPIELPLLVKGPLSAEEENDFVFSQAKKGRNIICFRDNNIVDRNPSDEMYYDEMGEISQLFEDLQEAKLIVIYDAKTPPTKRQKLSFFDKVPAEGVAK